MRSALNLQIELGQSGITNYNRFPFQYSTESLLLYGGVMGFVALRVRGTKIKEPAAPSTKI